MSLYYVISGMRRVPSDPRESSCLDLIRQWISQCTRHDGCSPLAPVALPKRVIEIPVNPSVPLKLRTSNGALGQYVILSHCWGSKGLVTLTNAVLSQYQEAIKLELLPKSFKDAIEITRRLGFRYLWIDALCIIQDKTEDWAKEAGKMASYYGLSTLMISATAAKDSSEGILTARSVLYSPILGREKRYYLCQSRLRSDADIDESVLATRGWAAQERMLAPRILHYTKRQMMWECAEEFRYEASDIAQYGQCFSQGYVKSVCQQYISEALSQKNTVLHSYYHDGEKVPERRFSDAFLNLNDIWGRCVSDYSFRSLTVPTDKLHAIAGVARMLNHSGELGEYLAGIWSAHLAPGLGWIRMSRELSSPPLYIAPSWSWAGAEGGVSWGTDIPQTSTHDTKTTWAKKFNPKLIEQHMILQDERNVYGAVLEGSYITVKGACLTHANLGWLLREAYGTHFSDSGHIRIDLDRGDQLDVPAPYDCCMFLMGDISYDEERAIPLLKDNDRSVDLLLLSWVDREAKVAQRIGIVQMTAPRYMNEVQFLHTFEAASWERWTLKLV
jgi:hypothetical protein